MSLVLASSSPQRRAILAGLGVEFEARAVDVAEDDAGPPREVARRNALRKARACPRGAGERVLGVDTLVATEAGIWGKPPDAAAAAETLRHLSGQVHEVISGWALLDGEEERCGEDVTAVTVRELDEATVAWYVATGEWRGRAGGYAIQGAGGALVRRIEGDYLNVVGLPVGALLDAKIPGFSLAGPA